MKWAHVLMPSISGCSCDGKSSVNHGSVCRERARPTPVASHGRTMGRKRSRKAGITALSTRLGGFVLLMLAAYPAPVLAQSSCAELYIRACAQCHDSRDTEICAPRLEAMRTMTPETSQASRPLVATAKAFNGALHESMRQTSASMETSPPLRLLNGERRRADMCSLGKSVTPSLQSADQ